MRLRKRQAAAVVAASAVVLVMAAVAAGVALGSDSHVVVPTASAGPPWPTNASGLTYGSDLGVASYEDEPDLILASAANGKTGYVLLTDLEGPMPRSPEEALSWQAAQAGKDRVIPVYLSDGTTKIGEFVVGAPTATKVSGG